LLTVLHQTRTSDVVFSGVRRGKPISNMAMLMLLRRMGRGELTAHGFRSTFRDWAAECTNFPREIAEMRWRMSSPTRSKPLTGAATSWPNAGSSWRRGDGFVTATL
jgi:integrase